MHVNRPITACGYIDKGGVGKTTSIGHFGVALAEEGYDVLLIDLAGKQGDLAKLFGIVDELDPEDWPNISTVFQPEWERVVEQLGDDAIDQLIHETAEGVDLIPPIKVWIHLTSNSKANTVVQTSTIDWMSSSPSSSGGDMTLFSLTCREWRTISPTMVCGRPNTCSPQLKRALSRQIKRELFNTICKSSLMGTTVMSH